MFSGVGELQVYFERVASCGEVPFRREGFGVLSSLNGNVSPEGEVLFDCPDCEGFFRRAQARGIAAEVDLLLFPQAVQFAREFKRGASVNVQTGTVFDDRFISVLRTLAEQKDFDPSKVWIEVTEQGKIPRDADRRKLFQICDMGFRLAVDDVDPSDPDNMKRVDVIDGAASMHKFSYKTMQDIRRGGQDADLALRAIGSLRRVYAGSVIVMEGVRPDDGPLLPLLAEAGVNLLQYRQA